MLAEAVGALLPELPVVKYRVPTRACQARLPDAGDAQGREVAWVEDLAALAPEVRRVLEDELARREFVPVLRRVLGVSAAVEPSRWEVETDRGAASFVLNNEDDVRRLGDHRALIIDAHGIRYLIPDVRLLDPLSRRLLERYL